MMDFSLTLTAIARRAEALFHRRPVVSRRPDGTLERTTYGECLGRARRLAAALDGLGIRRGDRIATLCWNHSRHLEAYFAIPAMGAVLHTLNLRLHPDELAYTVSHAGDRVVLADRSLLPLLEQFRQRTSVEQVIVLGEPDGGVEALPAGALDYERLIGESDGAGFTPVELDEREAAIMCYTSGTTGRPKGVVYSHRALVLHSMATAMAESFALREGDIVLAVIPMFHANAWGLPFTAAMVGAGLVFPGERPSARTLLELCRSERVTFSAGVPTVWLDLLAELDAAPGAYDVSSLRTIVVGGAAASESLLRGLEERHGIRTMTSWGMTELAPVGTLGRLKVQNEQLDPEGRWSVRLKQGLPGMLLELRVRNESGIVPWDGHSMGELEARGAYVASGYYQPEGEGRGPSDAHGGPAQDAECVTPDGWFRTGDIASIDPEGYLQIHDRSKDLIKSGGEWISSVALESALMTHPAVAEAAVVAVPDPRWLERPVAAVVLRPGMTATPAELLASLAPRFPAWWLPDEIILVPSIPRTSTGKFKKAELREKLQVSGLKSRVSGLKSQVSGGEPQ